MDETASLTLLTFTMIIKNKNKHHQVIYMVREKNGIKLAVKQ